MVFVFLNYFTCCWRICSLALGTAAVPVFCWPEGWKINSQLDAAVGSCRHTGLDFPLSQQVLATPDWVISPYRQVQNPKLRAWCCSQCLETKHFSNLFPSGTTSKGSGCGKKCPNREHYWEWGSSQCQGHLPLPRDLCAMCLCVMALPVCFGASSHTCPLGKYFRDFFLFHLKQSQERRW